MAPNPYRRPTAPSPQVTAAPVDTTIQYGTAGAPEQEIVPIDPDIQLADELSSSFGGLSKSLTGLAFSIQRENVEQEQASFEYFMSLANQYDNNNESLAKLVEVGQAHPSENPWVMRGRSRAVGEAGARAFRTQTESMIPELRASNPQFADVDGALGWFAEESASYFRSLPNAGGDRRALEKAFNNGIARYRNEFEVSQRRYTGEKALEESELGFKAAVQDAIEAGAAEIARESALGIEGPPVSKEAMFQRVTQLIDDRMTAWGPDKWPLTYSTKNRLAVDTLIEIATNDVRYTDLAVEALESIETGPEGSRSPLLGPYAEAQLLKARPRIEANRGTRRRGGTYTQAGKRWQQDTQQTAIKRLVEMAGNNVQIFDDREMVNGVISRTFAASLEAQPLFDEGELVRIATSDPEKLSYEVRTPDGEVIPISIDFREVTKAAQVEATMSSYFDYRDGGFDHARSLSSAVLQYGFVPPQFQREVTDALDNLTNFTLSSADEMDEGAAQELSDRFHKRVYEPWEMLNRAGFRGRLIENEDMQRLMGIYDEIVRGELMSPQEALRTLLAVKSRDNTQLLKGFSEKINRLATRSTAGLGGEMEPYFGDIEKRATMYKLIFPSATAEEAYAYGVKAVKKDSVRLYGSYVPRSVFTSRDAGQLVEVSKAIGTERQGGTLVPALLSGLIGAALDADVQDQLTTATAENIRIGYVEGGGYQIMIQAEGKMPFTISNPFRDSPYYSSEDILKLSRALETWNDRSNDRTGAQMVRSELGLMDIEDVDLGIFRFRSPADMPSLEDMSRTEKPVEFTEEEKQELLEAFMNSDPYGVGTDG